MEHDPKELEALQEITERNQKMIQNSRIFLFLTLFSDGYEKDATPVIQIGLAVLLDKPIGIIALRGAKVSEHLKKLAFSIEHVSGDDPESLTRATERLIEKAKELGL